MKMKTIMTNYKHALLLAGTMLVSTVLFAKGSWEEQQTRAESISAEYQAKYPHLRSDRIVFKKVGLPDGSELDLDFRIVRPKEGGPFPVVFFVHGGAWATGTKAQFTHESYVLADNGIAGVRMEYRWKKHGAKYPEAISDVMDAIDYVRQHAGELNLDFTRVGLAGGSAGGHLSSIAAQLTPECICYDGYNGLFDAFDRGNSRFGGGDYTGTTEKEKKASSAIYNIKHPPPDTFLYHGTEDTTVDIDVARRFAEAIREKGGKAELLVYEGVGHAFFNKNPYQAATTAALLAHTSYVFGLTDKKPVLADFALSPKIANGPDKFSILGQWFQKDDPSKVFEFKEGFVAISPSNVKLEWAESFGNHYIVWQSGHQRLIEIIDAQSIRIGKQIYSKK
jgi:acetyl esterase/lipase